MLMPFFAQLPMLSLLAGSGWNYYGSPGTNPIHPSAYLQKLSYYFVDGELITLYLGILLIIFAFYLFAFRLGRTKPLPELEQATRPPFRLSPAAIRYVENMGYDTKCLVVGVVNAAVKGCYRIKWGKRGFLAIMNEEPDFSVLSNDEKSALTFRKDEYWDSVLVAGKYSRKTRKMGNRMNTYLKKRYGELFRPKLPWFIGGLVISVLCGAALFGLPEGGRFLPGYLVYLFMLGGFIIVPIVFLRIAIRDRYWYGVLMCIFFLFAGVGGIGVLEYRSLGPYMTPVVIPIVALNYFFYKKLPTYTRLGQVVMREIRSYRSYLKARFVDKTGESPATPAEYFSELPYVMALDLDLSHTEYFQSILSKTQYEPYQIFKTIFR